MGVRQRWQGSEPDARLWRRSDTRRLARLAQIPRCAKNDGSGWQSKLATPAGGLRI